MVMSVYVFLCYLLMTMIMENLQLLVGPQHMGDKMKLPTCPSLTDDVTFNQWDGSICHYTPSRYVNQPITIEYHLNTSRDHLRYLCCYGYYNIFFIRNTNFLSSLNR